MTVFASAGHNTKGIKIDPGAVANGYKEADLTVDIRDLTIQECLKLGLKVIQDKDDERLGTYLERIKTGTGSVVLEFHFDAAASSTATGTTALIEAEADRLDKAFAKEIVDCCATTLGIKNRGVKSEKESHRGSLALMREEGVVCLLEVGFITNKSDLLAYKSKRKELAKNLALIIQKYENML